MAKYRNTKRLAYGISSPLPELSPIPVIAQRSPTTEDNGYELGTSWINNNSADPAFNDVWMLTSVSGGEANWEPVGSSTAGSAPITKYVVDADGSADYTTIQSALDAANAAGGGCVWVRPGTYAENLTLYAATQVVAAVGFSNDSGASSAIITGEHIPPLTGMFVFRNLRLLSATHIFSSAAVGSSYLIIADSVIGCTNGYTFNLPNWNASGIFEMWDSNCSAGTNDGCVNNTGGATFVAYECGLGNGTGNAMTVSGPTIIETTEVDCPMSLVTGAELTINWVLFNETVTFSNNSTGVFANCNYSTGAKASIVQNSTGAITLSSSTINTSNNPAIDGAGAGVITMSGIDFINVSEIAVALTLNVAGRSTTGGLKVVEGTNATSGTATLVGGTILVNTTAVTANSRIHLTPQGVLAGTVYVSARVAGTSFTITSTNAADTPAVAWMIVEPA